MLIHNAKVYTMKDDEAITADILVRDGKIVEVAGGIKADGEELFDASGYVIMPGIIDTSSRLGLVTSGMRWEGDDSAENSENDISRLSCADGFNCLDESIVQARHGGITTAIVTSAETSVIGAKSCAIKTTGETVSRSLVSDFCDLSVNFGNHPKRLNDRGEFPRSRMGIVSILRSALLEAKAYGEKEAEYNPGYEALLRVLDGEIPLKVCAYKCQDILTAIRIQKEFGVRMILNQCTEAYMVGDEIANSDLPVILGNYLVPVGDYEELGRRMDMAAELENYSIRLGISTHTQEIGYGFMAVNAALLVSYGLSEQAAMAALTIDAARIFGLDNRLGSIEKGKDADLLLLDGKPLYSMTSIVKTMINGVWTN
ncbi:MAG: amidohydrolase family protein [Lachnospiraceae bacterium]